MIKKKFNSIKVSDIPADYPAPMMPGQSMID